MEPVRVDRLVEATVDPDRLGADERAECLDDVRGLATAAEVAVESLLDALLELAAQGRALNDPLLAAVGTQLWSRYRGKNEHAPDLPPQRIGQIIELYRRLGPSNAVRHLLLRVLAGNAGEVALEAFVDTILADPPAEPQQCDLAFVPLFQLREFPVDVLFPRLLAAMADPRLAVQVLDLANHVTRRRLAEHHPARDRTVQLLELFTGLVNNLQDLEQRPESFAATPQELSRMVGGCVELIVALCAALALIGDERATGPLRQALDLSHRRVRIEAAAALSRLGEAEGTDTLVELAAEPSVRRRAITYLEEIGQEDQLPDELCSDTALAEGDFASWLAQPSQIGLPPHEIDLIDHRRQPWPGYEEPVDCYLFDYEYRLPSGLLRGVGIAGPVTHVLAADLSALPVEDVYAVYAGWHADHEEIRGTDAEQFTGDQSERADDARQELQEIGYEDVQVVKLGQFFDEPVVVATARVAGDEGMVVAAGDAMQWFPHDDGQPPMSPTVTYYLFKGRQLLAAFS